MSSDSDRIRQQIEYTRSELSSDVDALTDKVNPRRIAGDRVGQARGTLARAKEKVMGTSGHMSDRAGQMTDRAGQRMSQATGSVQHAGNEAGQRMSHAAGSVRDEARSLGQQSQQQMQGNPLAAGIIAFGAGLLVSALIPPSRQEQQWAGQAKGMVNQHSDELRGMASRAGHELRDNMREPAQQAARSVGSTAVKGAANVGSQGRSAAQQVSGQAQEAVGELRHR
ncbi:DUF3618 domain-containing protein [Micromonospora sp. NPDC048909]|uniref:DUF3618 domain-containing protein n=1 Tax=Micromonospora sp. NPDC048909 TaxID=3155643 RepID=UPI0033E41839